MSDDTGALAAKILTYLRDELRVDAAGLSPRDDLISSGRIDSVDLVRVATFLEGETGLAIPDGDITVDNFESVERMLAYVERRRGAKASG
jgi:acyl carrier protein